MYRVFLSYNTTRDEMVVVWRLQTLAAASGLHLEVLNSEQRSDWATVAQKIDEADSVIAFLTKQASKQVELELRYALSRGKPVIPIVERGVSTKLINVLLQQSGIPVFVLDPDKPGTMESNLAEYLRTKKLDKEKRNAILALAGTIAGLFLLQELTQN
ncbi:MAG TPA: TIR domain-containing protein [Blastocatellia bacterium]|nr:TIR domain-containing protein [Blastocatellia bacterium]